MFFKKLQGVKANSKGKVSICGYKVSTLYAKCYIFSVDQVMKCEHGKAIPKARAKITEEVQRFCQKKATRNYKIIQGIYDGD